MPRLHIRGRVPAMASNSPSLTFEAELERLPIPAIDDFAEILAEEPRWYDLGIHLEISATDLNEIRMNFRTNGIQRCLIEIFKLFRFRRVPVTWYDICDALLRLDNEPLVERIRNNYIFPKMKHYPITPPLTDDSDDGLEEFPPPPPEIGGETPPRNRNPRTRLVVERAVTEDFYRLMMFFNDIVLRIQRLLERIDDQEVLSDLQYVLREQYGIKPLPLEVATMERVFARLHPYYTFINYRLLSLIVEKFLPDEQLVQDELDEYAEKLDSFKDLPKVSELMTILKDLRDAPGGPRLIRLKLQESWKVATLRNFERMVKLVFEELYGLMAHLKITSGCICATWTLPLIDDKTCIHLLSDLVKSVEFMTSIGVMSLTIDDMVVFHNPSCEDIKEMELTIVNAITIGNCHALKLLLETAYGTDCLMNTLSMPLSHKNYSEILKLSYMHGHNRIVSKLLESSVGKLSLYSGPFHMASGSVCLNLKEAVFTANNNTLLGNNDQGLHHQQNIEEENEIQMDSTPLHLLLTTIEAGCIDDCLSDDSRALVKTAMEHNYNIAIDTF